MIFKVYLIDKTVNKNVLNCIKEKILKRGKLLN